MKTPAFAVSCLLVVLGLIAPLSTSRADPTVLNGSFEDPAYTPPSINGGGGTFWTPSNTSLVYLVSGNYSGYGTTPFGIQYLALTTTNANDQQSVPGFLTGENYVLDLWISSIPTNINPQLTVLITGAAIESGVFTPSPPSSSLSFLEVQLPFTAVLDGNINLELLDSGSAAIGVDNVSITAVPEPSSVIAMVLLTGTLATGAVRRLRRRR